MYCCAKGHCYDKQRMCYGTGLHERGTDIKLFEASIRFSIHCDIVRNMKNDCKGGNGTQYLELRGLPIRNMQLEVKEPIRVCKDLIYEASNLIS